MKLSERTLWKINTFKCPFHTTFEYECEELKIYISNFLTCNLFSSSLARPLLFFFLHLIISSGGWGRKKRRSSKSHWPNSGLQFHSFFSIFTQFLNPFRIQSKVWGWESHKTKLERIKICECVLNASEFTFKLS